MSYEFNGQSADVEQALAAGAPLRVGWFRFYFADQRWEWSEQVQRMHGYEPGRVTPTTELVLAHKHPEDRDRVAATIDEIVHTNGAFSTRHRIIDTRGKVHDVVVVGDPLYDDHRGDGHRGDGHRADGHRAVVGTQGFYIDVSPLAEQAQEDLVTAKLAEIAANRAGIEQAKGMLMLVYGIDDEAAFNVLRRLSQESNVRLRSLAETITEDFRAAAPGMISRSAFDQLLLTAHLRAGR
jgi:ANTAR domain/PAS fold